MAPNMFFYQISFVQILFSARNFWCIHIIRLGRGVSTSIHFRPLTVFFLCFIDFFLSFLTWDPLTHLKWALNWSCHSKYGVQSITVIWNKKRCHYLIRFNRNCTNVWQKTTITTTKNKIFESLKYNAKEENQ